MIYNGWGASIFSHFVPFRWREWWRPVEKHFYAVTEIWLFFSFYIYPSLTVCYFSSFYSSQYNNHNHTRFYCYLTRSFFFFFLIGYIYVCVCIYIHTYMCISRDRKNVPCITAIDGRFVDRMRILLFVQVCSLKASYKKKAKKRKQARVKTTTTKKKKKETHACMKARSRLIINSPMPLVELCWVRRESLSNLMSNVSYFTLQRWRFFFSYHARKKFHLVIVTIKDILRRMNG